MQAGKALQSAPSWLTSAFDLQCCRPYFAAVSADVASVCEFYLDTVAADCALACWMNAVRLCTGS